MSNTDHPRNMEKQTVRKVTRRIVPFILLLYVIAQIDRANIGYAALEMNKALGLTSEAFGIVSGIFFIGYFLFEVPSNAWLERYGSRIWITRILITWGIVSVATAFVQSSTQLYISRFLLGVAEAGFYPGIILYLTYWFRGKERASTIALFMTAVPISYILGAPVSTWIMDHIKWMGISGWRWMFVMEGLPAVLLGIVTYFYLTDRPKEASWLTKEEKNWLTSELEKERKEKEKEIPKQLDHKHVLLDPKVWYLSVVHFLYLTGNLGVGYWMPQIIKGMSGYLSNTQIGLIATIPYIVAAFVMIYWSRRSDRTGERSFHSAMPLLIGGLGLLAAGYSTNPFMAMTFITISLGSFYSFKGPFWALSQSYLGQASMALGIAVINSVGNLGGFIGPYAVGMLKDMTGTTKAGLFFLSVALLLGSILILIRKNQFTAAKKEVGYVEANLK
jgi:MFS transporter, ACS family, tartrate transporter